LVTNYATCPACRAALDRYWLVDWAALLASEQIEPGSDEEKMLARLVADEAITPDNPKRYPWTIVDTAMSLLTCSECGGELGSHYPTCGECGLAFGASILAEYEATANEHALHVGRYVLRFPRAHSQNAVAAWKLTMPRLLTGWLPDTAGAQRAMGLIKAERWDEVFEAIRTVDQEILRRGRKRE
jgi:uncharacterized protein (UPF0212 family)